MAKFWLSDTVMVKLNCMMLKATCQFLPIKLMVKYHLWGGALVKIQVHLILVEILTYIWTKTWIGTFLSNFHYLVKLSATILQIRMIFKLVENWALKVAHLFWFVEHPKVLCHFTCLVIWQLVTSILEICIRFHPVWLRMLFSLQNPCLHYL